MADIAAKTVIVMELDDSKMTSQDIPALEAGIQHFAARMQKAANIDVRLELNEKGKTVLKFEVDPKTTQAGMEVIRNIVKDGVADMQKNSKVNIGVNEKPIHSAMSRLKSFLAREGQSISDGIHFWMSRGLLKAGRDLVKLPAEMMKEAFSKFMVAEEATTKLAKALAATGESSGKSKEQLVAYAKGLEKITLVADQVTMGIQGILVTSEGLTGENFDRATRGALDLAAALGGDAATHAARLGKSLQDPVRGMEMLRDAGIAFSQEQQDTIKFLAETNELAAAQGILLDELESRFGGAANSTGTLNEQIKEQALNYENLQEKIGEVVAEHVDDLIPAMSAGIESMENLAPAVLGATVVLAELSIELAKTVLGIDGVSASTEDLIEKTDEWVASIKAGAAYLDESFNLEGITAAMDKLLISMGASGTDPNDPFYNMDLAERHAKRWNDEVAARKKARADRKKQAEEDAKQAKEDWKKEQEAKGIGQGKLSDAAKAAVQQAKDAKDAIKRNKDEQEQKRKEEAEFARQDAEAIRDHAKKVRDAQKAAREQEAKDKKKAKTEEKMLADEWSHEKKKMMAKEKEEAAEKAALARANGRESLIGMHDRIQDARFLNRPNTGLQMTTKQHAMSNGIKLTVEQEKVVDAVKAQTKAVVEAISKPFSALIGK